VTTETLNYIDAIAHLPAGGTLVFTDVPWEEYEELVDDHLGDFHGVRICYDHGRMEIMSPSSDHENFKELITALVRVLADETGLALESLGSTTYKQEWRASGVEPDGCSYVHNAARIIGHRIDLKTDPPPDIVVEVDISHESTRKLAIYAGMGVPELWRYDGQQVYIYQLLDHRYVEITASQTFPMISSDGLTRFLEQSKTAGQTAALKSFRTWLRAQTP
jgi:Uma2 family endonuclease